MHSTTTSISNLNSFKAFTILLLISILGLSACTKDQPSEEDIKAMVADRFDNDFSGIFTTSNVVKNNGYKKNENSYVAEVTITGTAQQSLDDFARSIMNDDTLSAIEKMTATMTIGLLKFTMPEFEAGDQVEFERQYLFFNTDNGWQLKQELKPNGEPLNSAL